MEARGACDADGNAVGTLLDKHRLILGTAARELVGDRGSGSETALRMCVERNVQPLLGVRASTNPHGGLDRKAFTYVAARDLYICPQGKELLTAATLNLKKLAGRRPEAHWGMAAMDRFLASAGSPFHQIARYLASRRLLPSLSPIP